MGAAIYNSRNPQMTFPSSRVRWAWCFCVLVSRLTFAADWHQPISDLAEKIAAVTGPGVVAVEVNNRSSISSADVEEIHREMTSALATAGVRVWQPDQAAANIKVTLSENLQNYVWVAEVRQAPNDAKVVMVSTPRTVFTNKAQNVPPISIRATPLVSQSDPILDVALLEGNPQRVLVLGRIAITIQEFQNGHWGVVQSLPISSPNPLPRDARGRILLRRDHLFDAYLPGLICRSSKTVPLQMSCSPSDDPWPLPPDNFGLAAFFSPTRNFFTGALVPGIGKQKSGPPFYSAAAVPRTSYTLWILAGLDGQVHLLDGINQQVLGQVRWGSDIAALHVACRPDWQVLADAAESESTDSIQVFELADREPAAVSDKLALNGRITALWPGAGGSTAIAVYRNSNTRDYEALQLNLDCAR